LSEPVVNLAAKQSPVIDQGDRPTCLAAATTGGHEYLRDGLSLSIEHLFSSAIARGGTASKGAGMETIRDAAVIDGQCEDRCWPYGYPAPTIAIEAAERLSRIGRGQIVPVSLDEIRRFLAAGQALVLGLHLNFGFLLGNVQPISVGPEGEGVLGLHAVLAVGYDDANHVVTIKNSWGTDWGEGGYGRLTYQYVERYGIEMLGLEL
jgi:hypothetical protein